MIVLNIPLTLIYQTAGMFTHVYTESKQKVRKDMSLITYLPMLVFIHVLKLSSSGSKGMASLGGLGFQLIVKENKGRSNVKLYMCQTQY